MRVCPKCERNVFENEITCSNCGGAVEEAVRPYQSTGTIGNTAEAGESRSSYGTFTGAATCYLVLCILTALVCLLRVFLLLAELDRPGVDTAIASLIGFGAVSLISGFIVYGFSKVAVDAANDIRLTAERATVQIKKTTDQTRLLASIANDLSTKELVTK